MTEKIKILGFAGSLRRDSYNKAILRAATEMAPENTQLEVFDLEGIPPFNQDQENQPPQKVIDFKAKIRAADAILIATPEYNYSIPGVLKNAIDWASRPYVENAWKGKPVAIMGASVGMLGTARAQYHLRQCFIFLEMNPLNRPEVMVSFAADKIRDGKLMDETSRKLIRQLLEGLVKWTLQLKQLEEASL